MNKAFFIGNLTKDPNLKTYDLGSVCAIDIAVDREYGDNEVDFFTVKVFGKQGENCNTYLKKGVKVAVEGRVENRKYQDKDGNTRYATEIIANRVEFLGKRERADEPKNEPKRAVLEEVEDNKLPF